MRQREPRRSQPTPHIPGSPQPLIPLVKEDNEYGAGTYDKEKTRIRTWKDPTTSSKTIFTSALKLSGKKANMT